MPSVTRCVFCAQWARCLSRFLDLKASEEETFNSLSHCDCTASPCLRLSLFIYSRRMSVCIHLDMISLSIFLSSHPLVVFPCVSNRMSKSFCVDQVSVPISQVSISHFPFPSAAVNFCSIIDHSSKRGMFYSSGPLFPSTFFHYQNTHQRWLGPNYPRLKI